MTDLVQFLRKQAAFDPEAGADERAWCGKIAAAADEIERLRADLKPFADWGAKMVGRAAYGDSCPLGVDPDRTSPGATVGDLRHALATLLR